MQFWESIKSFDTEDKIDLYFYRPFGFFLAKLFGLFRFSPTMVTILGMFFGIISGFFFYNNSSTWSLIWASFLFVLAGVLDSADGQLARMSGNFSRIGLVLDGVCDNIVFASAYIGSCLAIQDEFGYRIWILAIVAGIFHSIQSSALDFYNREYLFFGCGLHKGDYWNPSPQEAEEESKKTIFSLESWSWKLRMSWLRQQQITATRTVEEREAWRQILSSDRGEEFKKIYREKNRFVLRLWRPLGANVHTIMILFFCFLRRFELYLLFVDIIVLTLWLLVVRMLQSQRDKEFREEILLQKFL